MPNNVQDTFKTIVRRLQRAITWPEAILSKTQKYFLKGFEFGSNRNSNPFKKYFCVLEKMASGQVMARYGRRTIVLKVSWNIFRHQVIRSKKFGGHTMYRKKYFESHMALAQK